MNTQIEKIKQDITASLCDECKPWFPLFNWIEQTSGVPRLYVFLGCVVFVALYLVFGYGAQILCNLVGIAYPAYASMHAIETSTKVDDTKWLVYWVTFACLTLLEHFSVFLCSCIPFYYLIKCIFLVWCMIPVENNGSSVIYHRVLRPYFLKHHEAADKVINDVTKTVKKSIESVTSKKDE